MPTANDPRTQRIDAPSHWSRVEFLSDIHLSSSSDRTWAAFANHLLNTTADAVFLLGDVVDAWVGDDAASTPSFEQDLIALLRQAAEKRSVAFLPGNRDFLLGSSGMLSTHPKIELLADVCQLRIFGRRLVLVHGDAECLADHEYQAVRERLRAPAWQAGFLARPLIERRVFAQEARRQSMAAHQLKGQSDELWADLDPARCIQLLQSADAATLIHGHTHRPGQTPLPSGFSRVTLSDWDLEASPPRAEVLSLTAEGMQRLPVTVSG